MSVLAVITLIGTFSWVVAGAIAGWLAGQVLQRQGYGGWFAGLVKKTEAYDIVGDIAAGVVGAAIFGLFFGVIVPAGYWADILFAFLGGFAAATAARLMAARHAPA